MRVSTEPCRQRRLSGGPCGGEILPTGYCGRCGRRRDALPLPEPGDGPRGPRQLLKLPPRTPRSPEERLAGGAHIADQPQRCRRPDCGATIPVLADRPDPQYCPRCGKPHAMRPDFAQGATLSDQYHIKGPVARGGQGWVYLAEDTHLDDLVAVKTLRDRYGAHGAALADLERRTLVASRHPYIVRIRDFLPYEAPASGEDSAPEPELRVRGGHIVMEDVGDHTLQSVIDEVRRGRETLDIEHVATYGIQILTALSHLHQQDLLYGDMKPSNVVHVDDHVKVIDMGSVRKLHQTEPPPHVTPGFHAPELAGELTLPNDLHTVGVTLRCLAAPALRDDVPGLGTGSLDAVIDRATRTVEEGPRFKDAEEMADQLRGALREIRALRGKGGSPEASGYFDPSSDWLGERLGDVPATSDLARPGEDRPLRGAPPVLRVLDPGRPTPVEIARRLPVPKPFSKDPRTPEFGVSGGYARTVRLQQAPDDEPSAEICLHNIRVALAVDPAPPDVDAAEAELALAEGIPGPEEVRRWRLEWHRGLIAFARFGTGASGRPAGLAADLAEACRSFELVRADLPGEYAPKLALAYAYECAAHAEPQPPDAAGARARARELFHAVHLRNPAHCGAALGLARLALDEHDRDKALAALERVPRGTRGRTLAQRAATRIRAACLGHGPEDLPSPEAAEAVLAAHVADRNRPSQERELVLAPLDELRLRIEVNEWQLAALHLNHGITDAGEATLRRRLRRLRRWWRPAREPTPDECRAMEVRVLLERDYLELAATDPDLSEALVERAHAVRPTTLT
ncbi:protein kinase domain-containing protein [Streptomyces hawaiiensis]|uniref:protein kinase domain-containing protein n=1 Tax=Streptomyces hawaiiensis TaxID=67305 RepID=UPI003660325E